MDLILEKNSDTDRAEIEKMTLADLIEKAQEEGVAKTEIDKRIEKEALLESIIDEEIATAQHEFQKAYEFFEADEGKIEDVIVSLPEKDTAAAAADAAS